MGKLFANRKFSLIISIILAVLLWLVVSMNADDTVKQTIYDVPVQLDYNASAYQSFGLDLIDDEPVMVDVTVEGPRSVVGGLTTDDFLVYPNVNAVTTGGIKTLRLVSTTVNNTVKYSITGLSQETVMLRFDRIISQKFKLQIDTTGIDVEDGYLLNSSYATPDELTVTGPSEEINMIDRVEVELPGMKESAALTESSVTEGVIHLLNENGEEVDSTLLTVDHDQVEVNIPILRRDEMQLKVQFFNVPRGFDVNTLNCTLDHDSINVAVPTSQGTDAESYVVGYIDFSTMDYHGSMDFDVELPDDYINLDNIQTVTASFDTADYQTKLVPVSNIQAVNVPEDMKIQVETQTIYNVLLVGPSESIKLLDELEEEGVLDEYVIAQVDAGKVGIQSGEQLMSVQILLPSLSDVFASGAYKVYISVG